MRQWISLFTWIAWNWALFDFYKKTRGESIKQSCIRMADWLYDLGNDCK
jgi:hypothetical protein